MSSDDLVDHLVAQSAARTDRLIGATDESRLRWLIKFARVEDFDPLPSTKFYRLQREIRAFAALAGSSSETADNMVSRKAAGQLARWVADGLRAYAGKKSWDLPSMSIARFVIPGSNRSAYGGIWTDTFLMSAADALQAAGKRLRICAAEGCGVLFVKRKRRIFCSEKCSGRVRMLRFQKDPEKYKAKRRSYYLKSLERMRTDSQAR